MAESRDDRPLFNRPWLARNVVALGLVSLLTDTSSEMVLPLLPAFVTGVLGAGALALGWIEGAAETVASLLKLVSGRWADRTGKNRPFVIAGYTLASLARPLVALASATWQVLAVRVTDRIGKGLRTSPRDAMIAASVPAAHRGQAYGFHRAMDHTGAVLGPLLAVAVLALSANNLRLVFALSAIPAALAIVAAVLGVREVARTEAAVAQSPAKSALPPRRLLLFLVPLGLFTLGNASDIFLLLKAGQSETPLLGLPLLWMAFHLVKAATAVPGGRLADRLNPRPAIALGWLVYALVYFGFAWVSSPAPVIALFLVYGVYYGLTEAAEKALVARLAPSDARGTAFGWYHLTIGLLALPASVLFGFLWDAFGDRVAFCTSAALAGAALIALWLLVPSTREEAPA